MSVTTSLTSLCRFKRWGLICTINKTPVGITQMGSIDWRWKDTDGQNHAYTLHDIAYIPVSPVKLLSLICFVKELNNQDGTHIC